MTSKMTAAQLQAFYRAEGDTGAKKQDREGPIHKAILQLLDLTLPPDAIYHHSPNELDMAGEEAARQIAKARNLGTKPGWPDIEIIWRGRAFFLEVKADKGRQSEAQAAIQVELGLAGAPYEVVRSVTEAELVLIRWGLVK
jgi:hypothetical protein